MCAQPRLDLAQLDTKAAQFDLVVIATEIIEIAICTPTRQIAAAVHARTGIFREWIGHEAFGGQIGASQITARQLWSGDMQLTGHANRCQFPVCIEYVQAQMRNRLTDRHATVARTRIVGSGRMDCAADHRLGGAVLVDDTGVRCKGLPTG